MELMITVLDDRSGDAARDLRRWLADQDDLRGRVRLAGPQTATGSLGSLVDTLAVSVAPGGAAGILAASLITWIRHRTGTVQAVVRRPDGGQVEVSAERVRGLDAPALRAVVADLAESLGRDGDAPGERKR